MYINMLSTTQTSSVLSTTIVNINSTSDVDFVACEALYLVNPR